VLIDIPTKRHKILKKTNIYNITNVAAVQLFENIDIRAVGVYSKSSTVTKFQSSKVNGQQ
jgi:hypothetical protein